MIDYDKLELNKKGQVTLKSLMYFLLYCSSEERWDAFWEITHDELAQDYPMSWKTFYKGLQFAYGSGKAPHSEASEMFNEIDDFTEYATKEEVKWLKRQLDNHGKITVYRGCTTGEIDNENIGVSWTTDLGIAEFFAYRFKDKAIEAGYQPCVIKANIHWGDIKGVLLDREEDETVIPNVFADEVEIISTEPTEAFEKYMKNK